MKFKYRLIFFLWAVLLINFTTQAQNPPKKDTTKAVKTKKKVVRKKKRERDSLWKPLKVAGIRFGADILPTVFGVFDNNYTSYQGTFEVLLNNKYFIELSGGTEQVIRRGAGDYTYTNQGIYGRIGINYNMLHKKTEDDAIYVGLHYGYAQFDNDIKYSIVNPLGAVTDRPIAEKGLSGSWLEFNFGFRVELFKNLYMGPMFRVKTKLTASQGELLVPNDMPGYGPNNAANFAFGYHLLYRIPFRKAKKRKVKLTPGTIPAKDTNNKKKITSPKKKE